MQKNNANNLSEKSGDLSQCDKEAIHLFAAIQGHGCVLFFSYPDLRVQSASANVADLIGSSHQDVLGARLSHLLDIKLVETVTKKASEYPWSFSNGRYFQYVNEDSVFECYLYHSEGLFALEIEKVARESDSEFDHQRLAERIKFFHKELKSARDLSDVADIACKAVRAVTDLDRVMLYRFIYPNMHGEVIGEDRVIHAHSFMGHRFPSSDIPAPARNLYLRNETRIIGNIDQADSAVLPPINPLTGKTLDMSDSRLRAVSKIHLQYLRNMRVKASLSFAITVRGELWGLIACHHLDTFRLNPAQRAICELIAEAVAAHAPMIEALNLYRLKTSFETRLSKTIENLQENPAPLTSMLKNSIVPEIFRASGMALTTKEQNDFVGITPRSADLQELASQINAELSATNRNLISTNDIQTRFPKLKFKENMVAGVLAIKIRPDSDSLLMIFRPEIVKTITWGGDPVKQLSSKGFEGSINPRTSFETWEETIRGQSADWYPFECDGATKLAEFVRLNQ